MKEAYCDLCAGHIKKEPVYISVWSKKIKYKEIEICPKCYKKEFLALRHMKGMK
jgi:hypothetical protein